MNQQSAVHNPQSTIMEIESAHTSGVYPKRPLAIVAGRGARVWDAEGREYIDCVGGQGAANLGHAHPAIVAAINQQAAQLITCPEIFYNDRRAELLAALAAVAPAGMERAFLCNSGAEAVEAAIKFSRLSTGRPGIVAAIRGFHGRTMGALSATWNKEYRQPFEPLVPGFVHVPYNDLAALDASIRDDTAAVLLEVVQGEGGVHPGTPEYLHARAGVVPEPRRAADPGRSADRLWPHRQALRLPALRPRARPDGRGEVDGRRPPHGCVPDRPGRGSRSRPMSHGSTFGGNPLACAAALATLEVMSDRGSARTGGAPGRVSARTPAGTALAGDQRGARAGAAGRRRSAGQGHADPAEAASSWGAGPARRLHRPPPAAAAGDRAGGFGSGNWRH